MKDEGSPNENFRNLWENLLKLEQNNICDLFESLDTTKFQEEIWTKKNSKKKNIGGGITRILENGTVFEKCAVNYSCVYGTIDRETAKQMCVNQYNKEYIDTKEICYSDDINNVISRIINNNNIKIINEKYKYYASGISIIAHPVNPNAPSIHSNFRFFQVFIKTGRKKKKNSSTANNNSTYRNTNIGNNNAYTTSNKGCGNGQPSNALHSTHGNISSSCNSGENSTGCNAKSKISSNYKSLKHWFGGGCDLSPCYIFPELFIHFHHSFKLVCDKYNHLFYKYFKKWCDLYFRIRHRNISRGIGGIFFDNLLDNNIKIKSKGKTKNSKSRDILTINLHNKNSNNYNSNHIGKKSLNEQNTCKCYSCNCIMDKSYKIIYLFIQECIINFKKSYLYILAQTINCKYDSNMINWQRVCRGRYAEFNLIYDRGTKFGLELNTYKIYRRKKKSEKVENYVSTNYLKDEIFSEQNSDYFSDEHEKIDNVFSSLPLKCEFFYKYKIVKYSREYETLQILKHPKKWVDY
ncbi:coproporphyrinogen-III oxidase [Plasmodium gonderi]|uniref:coproporphyrinogen oxidase n=1 Tax=Plasmodium gonderi TaxID=77519 RepID=A0A1Y1JFA0_PLAGO|nr:coproporphyrinogen-III oxidase [Plasmodium gonderi]GAW81186.1 coproporphyrinogen-III oxidase [Plasmodium gonderi]